SASSSDAADLIRQLNLPDWMFPKFASKDPAARGAEQVIQEFYNGAPVGDRSIWHRIEVVPWRLWITPAISWGIFLSALFGAVVLMGILFRRQWSENERLPFPLASVFVSLIEEPKPGHWINDLLRSKVFWLSAGGIFAIHAISGLHEYFRLTVPD